MAVSGLSESQRNAVLAALRGEASVEEVCRQAGVTRKDFEGWLQAYLKEKVPPMWGELSAGVHQPVEIFRDAYSIPHIYAQNLHDLFFALGYVMAQDRLFQIDFLRRQAMGRLAEVFGEEKVESDILYRTLAIHRIAEREEARLSGEAKEVLEAFSAGVNEFMRQCCNPKSEIRNLPFEFDVLDYVPEKWRPRDSIAILRAFWWYLTGRLHLLAGPETAKRLLGDEQLYQAFLTPEGKEESIIPKGCYPTERKEKPLPVGETICVPDNSVGGASCAASDAGQDAPPTQEGGSNNWVVAGFRAWNKMPMLASDPHLPLALPSTWYEAHLCGAGFNVAGILLPGTPGIWMGRNEKVAWGATNNICSMRDLYELKLDPNNPNRYEHNGQWHEIKTVTEEIKVKGKAPVHFEVRFTHFGPIVNHLLPQGAVGKNSGAAQQQPIALRWVGFEPLDEIRIMLSFERAQSLDELREALREWRMPTWNFVGCDVDGHIGYQCVGQIPWRVRMERGYRKSWEAEDDWHGYLPFEAMPHWIDPERGWIATANNRVVPDDYPYPLFGMWASDHRAQRLHTLLSRKDVFMMDDFQRMLMDTYSVRAEETVPLLMQMADGRWQMADERMQKAIQCLKEWDYHFDEDSVGATIFEVWFFKWCECVAHERFPNELDSFIVPQIAGLAQRVLERDDVGWFKGKDVKALVQQTFQEALDWLTTRLSDCMTNWRWGKLHTLTLKHPLSERGGLVGEVVTVGPMEHHGGHNTVNHGLFDPTKSFETTIGVSYRLIVDMSRQAIYGCNCGGQSGHPASPHYADQVQDWLKGKLHIIPLERDDVEADAKAVLRLTSR